MRGNPNDDTAICATCMYWQSDQGGNGDCRRHSHSVTTTVERGFVSTGRGWPKMHYDDWCGDHKQTDTPHTIHGYLLGNDQADFLSTLGVDILP